MALLTTRQNGDTITAPWFNSIKECIDQDLILTPLSVTADKTLGIDANVISASSLSGAVDLDLPALTDNDKKYYILKATDLTNGVTVNPDGSDTIDGETEYVFANLDESIAIVGDSTNSNWIIVSTAFDSTGGGDGGAGSASIYALVKPENTLVSEWDTTNLANATFGLESTTPLAGDSSYLLTNITGSVNEYIVSPNIAVPLRSRAKSNGINFPFIYDGDDNDIEVSIYDVTNAATLETLLIKTAETSTTGSIVPYIPETCEEIQFIVTVKVVNNGKEFIFDDIEFSDDPFSYKDLLADQSFVSLDIPLTQVGTGGDYTVQFDISSPLEDNGSGLFTVINSNPSGAGYTEVTATKDIVLSIAADIVCNATGDQLWVEKNEDGNRLLRCQGYSGSTAVATSGTVPLRLGESVRVHAGGFNGTQDFGLSVSAISETAAVVHESTGTENSYGAHATGASGAAVAITDSTPKISGSDWLSISYTSTGLYSINYSALGLADTPTFQITCYANGAGYVSAVTASTAVVAIRNLANAQANMDFDIKLFPHSTDYKQPNAYAVTPLTETGYIEINALTYTSTVLASTSYKAIPLVSSNVSWLKISSNQATIDAGLYNLDIPIGSSSAAGFVDLLVRNITDSSDYEEFLDVVWSTSGDSSMNTVTMSIDIAKAVTFEFRTRAQVASGSEWFSRIKITKLLWS